MLIKFIVKTSSAYIILILLILNYIVHTIVYYTVFVGRTERIKVFFQSLETIPQANVHSEYN